MYPVDFTISMQKLVSSDGKNALWQLYREAKPLVRAEIILELKKVELDRYWRQTASKAGYDLPNAKGQLRDIFIRLMPETAPLFGLPAPKHVKKLKTPGPAPLFDSIH